MTRLCMTLNKASLEDNLHDLGNSRVDLAELRIDLLSPDEWNRVPSFPGHCSLPVILTCRRAKDGGQWKGSSSQREELLLKALEGNFAFLDLEEDEESSALPEKARKKGVGIIRSIHDFSTVPENLSQRLECMGQQGDLVKAAVMPRGIGDLHLLFTIAAKWKTKHPDTGLILLGMGAYGVPSRLLAGKMGSYCCFCSPDKKETAPGHMSCPTVQDMYRVSMVDEQTAIFGIIGNPVLHSLSPKIHNSGFHHLGLNAVYIPFTVDDLDAFFSLASDLGIRGFSVTVPFKEKVRRFLKQEDEGVRAVGACNTVCCAGRDGQGPVYSGSNTDVMGFIKPLKALWKDEAWPARKKAAVIGAGGAARSAVYALKKEGWNISVFNRTERRARELAHDFSCRGGSLESLERELLEGESFDLLVQTSPAGMEGTAGPENPVPFYSFSGKELVYDIVYAPVQTPLIKAAAAAGCRVLGGMAMLKEQAKIQFRIFTGEDLE